MIYYTQFIFIKKGQEEIFHAFEDNVLPLLEKHSGKLLSRVRLSAENILHSSIGNPYEIHLVSFESKKGFESYRDDKERQRFLDLKEKSIEKAMLMEGNLL